MVTHSSILAWRIPWTEEPAAAAANSLQSCLTLCNPIDGSPPGSPIPGILQVRTRVGCHFRLQCKKVKSKSEVTQSCQTLSNTMDCSLPGSSIRGFSRQEYWSVLPLPSLTEDPGRLQRITELNTTEAIKHTLMHAHSAYKLNKQNDSIQPCHTPFPILNHSAVLCPILTIAS